jgi:hypothetical protein
MSGVKDEVDMLAAYSSIVANYHLYSGGIQSADKLLWILALCSQKQMILQKLFTEGMCVTGSLALLLFNLMHTW